MTETRMAEKLADLAPRIMASFHRLRQHGHADSPLTMRHYQTLVILESAGLQSLSQLCSKLHCAASTGTELVNRMITLGYIDKDDRKGDRRHVTLSIAPQGRVVMQQRREALISMFTRFLATVPESDRMCFLTCFETIWKIIDAADAS